MADCSRKMFNDERLPLFSKNGYTSDESISGNTSNDVVVPVYGTTCEPAVSNAKLVPVEERITYTWSGINVFTNVGMVSNESNFFPCWNTNLDQGVQGKHLLKNVSGMAYPGELLAILGSSGAGKTTLLNALTFRSAKNITVTGTRCVNGTTVNSKALTSLSAYVQQDELFIGSLTVKEHLRFQALVRMDANISYEERMQRVNEVILEMTLNKCENTCIGISGRLKGISGGELKRLSFAAEVLTNPSLMFCDEPTSGLDSFMALNVVQTLKSMAQSGKTVICTIHQPSSELYTMFDKLLLMAEGRIAFLGTPEDADLFFRELEAPCPKNYNPADYFIQLLAIVPGNEESCRNAVNMICDRFQRSEAGVQVALESATASGEFLRHNGTEVWLNGNNGNKSPYKASWCAQFRAVVWRSWLSIIKEPLLVRVRLFQTILVSLVLGAIYYGQVINQDGVMNINGAIFLFLTNMTFQNVFAVINVFSAELPIFLREHKNGMYRTDVYFLGKTIADIPIFIFLPILFTAICYYMIGLNSEMPRFFVACGIVILVANAATSFGKCKEPLVQVVGGQILKKFAQSQHEIKRVSMEAATPDRVGQVDLHQRTNSLNLFFGTIRPLFLGYLISCISPTVAMALSIGPPLLIPFLLFGGFLLNIKSIPIYFQWLAYLSWFKYGNEALMVNQWDNISSIQCPAGNSSCPKDGHVVLEVYSFASENLALDICSLFGLIILFRVLAFCALLWKTYKDTEPNTA
uniref:Protein white n=1 Tax=Dendroctonus ponderosae TaxID=77166 RepID=A0AAR5QJ71_DENPD